MPTDNTEFISSLLRKLAELTYIKPGEVPNIDLYMDQVTTFMDSHLGDVKRYENDKTLTKTMINNYTKNKLLPPPVKKKYSSDHLYILAFIYYFKNILSINDIQTLLGPLTDKFFGENAQPSLDTIYQEVYKLQKEQLTNIFKDVKFQYKKSINTFTEMDDLDDKSYLQMFSFITMLGFDIYMKKNIIESILDEMKSTKEEKTEHTSQK